MSNPPVLHENKSLPNTWIKTSIGEISDVVSGGTPRADNPANFTQPGSGIAWLTPADLSGYTEKYISHGARDLTEIGYESSSAKLIPAGSLLFSSRAPIGYVVIAKNEICTNQGFKSFIFPKEVDPSYAYYYLLSIREVAENLGTGTTFKEISGTAARNLPFILPSFEEQKVIASRLDSLIKMVETSKNSLVRVHDLIKNFRQAVLTAAVGGCLTNNQKYDDQDRKAFIKLGDAGIEIKTGPFGSTLHKSDYIENGIPVINPMHISEGKIYPSKAMSISEEKYNNLEAWHLKNGDIILGRRGEMGRAATVRTPVRMLCGTGSLILRVPENILPEYLEIILRSPDAVSYFNTASVGSTMVNLNQKVIKDLEIYFPSIDEQSKIVKRVEQLLVFSDVIEEKVNTSRDFAGSIVQSILVKAFYGGLTSDWRANNLGLIEGENSAKALYNKIKRDRESLTKQPKPKHKISKRKADGSMNRKIINVVDALKYAGEPLNGQQLLAAAGYPNNSSTEELERFFLDIRNALTQEKLITLLERSEDGQDWFALTHIASQS